MKKLTDNTLVQIGIANFALVAYADIRMILFYRFLAEVSAEHWSVSFVNPVSARREGVPAKTVSTEFNSDLDFLTCTISCDGNKYQVVIKRKYDADGVISPYVTITDYMQRLNIVTVDRAIEEYDRLLCLCGHAGSLDKVTKLIKEELGYVTLK